ncbi:MAG: hypothetical protein ACSHWN_10090 [Methylophilaceae bacterium]
MSDSNYKLNPNYDNSKPYGVDGNYRIIPYNNPLSESAKYTCLEVFLPELEQHFKKGKKEGQTKANEISINRAFWVAITLVGMHQVAPPEWLAKEMTKSPQDWLAPPSVNEASDNLVRLKFAEEVKKLEGAYKEELKKNGQRFSQKKFVDDPAMKEKLTEIARKFGKAKTGVGLDTCRDLMKLYESEQSKNVALKFEELCKKESDSKPPSALNIAIYNAILK